MGADGRFVLLQDLGDLCGGISLVVKEMDGLPVLDGKSLHRVPDKGKVLPLLRSQGVAEFICRAYFVVCQAVFAQISRYAQEPRLSMGAVFNVWDRLEKLEQRVLQDLLRVSHVVEVCVGQTQNTVSICGEKAFCQLIGCFACCCGLCPICPPRWNKRGKQHRTCPAD